MVDYRVKLEIFSGPLDLLLYLVRKEEVDIYDISISKITEQYLRYTEMLKSFDIDLAGDFLVMAATLMQIKSAMLLPKADVDDMEDSEGLDPRSELIRQLLEYKKYKDAANLLECAAEDKQKRFGRTDAILERIEPESEPELDLDSVSVWDLLEVFDNLMKATGSLMDISNIKDDTPIDLYQIDILDRLQNEGGMVFEKLFEGQSSRVVMVGHFLALLELARNGLISIQQDQSKSIYLKSLTEEEAELAVRNAIMSISFEEEEQDLSEEELVSETGFVESEPKLISGQAPIAIESISSGVSSDTEDKTISSSSEDTIPISEIKSQLSSGPGDAEQAEADIESNFTETSQ